MEHHPKAKRLWVQFPVRAHTWVAGQVPGPGTYNLCSGHIWKATSGCFSLTLMFLSLSPFLSLKSIEKKCPQVRIKKVREKWGLFPLPLSQVAFTDRMSMDVMLCMTPAQASTHLVLSGFVLWLCTVVRPQRRPPVYGEINQDMPDDSQQQLPD